MGVAAVIAISSTARAVNADGCNRALKPGNTLRTDGIAIVPAGSRVNLVRSDGQPLTLGGARARTELLENALAHAAPGGLHEAARRRHRRPPRWIKSKTVSDRYAS